MVIVYDLQSKPHVLTREDWVSIEQKHNTGCQRTPFMMGIKDAGSVDMEASSRKTTGKSITFNATAADVMHVVQICIDENSVQALR